MSLVTVTAVNGAQQRATADAFRAAGWEVRPTLRQAGLTAFGPAAAADLRTGAGLAAAFAGADAVAITLPQDHTPGAAVAIARHVAEAAAGAGAPLVVFNFATAVADDAEGSLHDDLRAVRDILVSSGVPVARIEATAFMENLLAPWSVDAIAGGILAYPPLADGRVAWMSHATLGAAMVAAAERGAGRWRIGGPEALTGDETAVALARVVGHEVQFAPPSLAELATAIDAAFGAPAGERIASIYAYAASHPEALAPGDADVRALGVTPETLDAFLARTGFGRMQ